MDGFIPSTAALRLVQSALQSSTDSEAVRTFIQDLPVLSKEQVSLEDNCPICLVPFLEILQVKGDDEENGITKIEGCGHLFCRKDLIEWIKTHHLNCPTCRFQFIQSHTDQDDVSSDGGEYLPSPEGEEDIELNATASDFMNFLGDGPFVSDWDEIDSSPVLDPELEGLEGEEEVWMDNHDPEYDDISVEGGYSDLEYMEEGYEDSELGPTIEEGEDVEDSLFDSCLEEEQDGDPFRFGFHQATEPEPEFDPAYQDSWDPPEFNTAEEYESYEPSDEMEYEAQDDYSDNELAVNETYEDEALQYESDSDLANEAEYDLNCIDDVLGELEDNHPVGELISDSEQEELEVELGLTDGESNAHSAGRTKFDPLKMIPSKRLFITPTTHHS